MRRHTIGSWLFAVLVLVRVAHAQTPPAGDPYATESVVIERLTESIVYSVDGSLVRTTEVRLRVQSAAGLQQVGTLVLAYNRDLGTAAVKYVRVHKPDGSVVSTPPSSAVELPADVTRAAPTFTGVYLQNLNVQGLAVGDTIEYATEVHERSVIPGRLWFQEQFADDGIVLDEEIRISVPDEVPLVVKSRAVQPVTSRHDGVQTYVWRTANLKSLTEREASAKAYADRDAPPDIQVTSFHDWNAVSQALTAVWRGRADVTPDIRAKALELTAAARTDGDKARAIYRFVATHIRYVAVVLGIGRIQPHTASEVLANGFGDCKDQHTLLVTLMRAAGIRADAVLITPGERLDPDVPSPGQFNHVITFLPEIAGGTWLDSTLEVAPFGFLAESERDRDVLLIDETGSSRIVRTPAAPIRAASWQTDVAGVLDDRGRLKATVAETFSGDYELVLRTLFRQVPQARWAELLTQMSISQKFEGTPTNIHASPPDETDAPFRVTYDYVNDAFPGWSDGRLSAVFPQMGMPVLPDKDPAVPFRIGLGAGSLHATSRIELPVGYDARFRAGTLPTLTLTSPFEDYRLTNTIEGRTFHSEREVTIKTAEVPVAEFAEYRRISQQVGDDSHMVLLSRQKPWTWRDSPTIEWYAGVTPSTVSTLKDAVSAVNGGDAAGAQSLLDGIPASESDQPAVGLIRGWIQVKSGNAGRGLETLQMQAARKPSPSVYKQLALGLVDANRPNDAVRAWKRGRELYPDDREFPFYLTELLIRMGRYQEAIDTVQGVMPRQLPSGRLWWNLGLAYLGNQQTDEAVAAFTQAAAVDSSPEGLNGVAWTMAERHVGLDKAREFAARAIDETERAVERLTLASFDQNGVMLMQSLAAYWDTIAWVDYAAGDLAGAERYMQPAWDLAQQGVYAAHLASMLEAEGDRDGAAAYFARASRVDEPDGSAPLSLLALVHDETVRNDLLQRARSDTIRDSSASVPRIPGLQGQAQVLVRIGQRGKVDDVRFVSGDEGLRPEVEMVRTITAPSRLPPSSTVHIIRGGTLTCDDSSAPCVLTLTPAAQVRMPK